MKNVFKDQDSIAVTVLRLYCSLVLVTLSPDMMVLQCGCRLDTTVLNIELLTEMCRLAVSWEVTTTKSLGSEMVYKYM